jgi:hypothetical protein
VPFHLVALAALVATMIAVGTVAARSAKDPTQMYRDGEDVGRLVPGQIGQYRAETWDVDCEGSPFVTRGRSPRDRTRINVHHWDGAVDGYALFKNASRWVIYFRNPYRPSTLAGFAVRRSATRWVVLRRTGDGWIPSLYEFGYTIGPDGPPAAAALLIAGC